MTIYQCAQVVPDFRDVRIQSNSAGISVKSIPVLVDLVVQDTDRAPEGWVAPIAINRLLVCFVRFRVFLLRHVTSAK